MNDKRTPLFIALVEHANRKTVSFHILGHKKGEGMKDSFKLFSGENV
ncbi:hypothetical protein [Bacillus cereus]|nr:hypothetical protein [Bacillus cereus]